MYTQILECMHVYNSNLNASNYDKQALIVSHNVFTDYYCKMI